MAFFSDPLTFKIAGMAGVLTVLLGSLVAGFFYRGKDGERYSPLNHFISELGEEGVSAKAGWFNLSLIVSGLCLLAACISLGLILPGTLARIAGVIGALCALSLALVGLFPVNLYKQHAASAMAFFLSGNACSKSSRRSRGGRFCFRTISERFAPDCIFSCAWAMNRSSPR